MKHITTICKAVTTMANQLHKLGYTLSKAFRTAWRRVKESMTIKVSGVTYENRQQLLEFIAGKEPEQLKVYLRRDKANLYDKYAVAVVVGIQGVGYAHIGYVPQGLTQSFYRIIELGFTYQAKIQVIGGYGEKEYYGALVNIAM